jgi:hypothetical protein
MMEESMLSVKGIYENGHIRLLEPIPSEKPAKVIVTVLDELDDAQLATREVDLKLLDDLVGAIDLRADGSVSHDKYIVS